MRRRSMWVLSGAGAVMRTHLVLEMHPIVLHELVADHRVRAGTGGLEEFVQPVARAVVSTVRAHDVQLL